MSAADSWQVLHSNGMNMFILQNLWIAAYAWGSKRLAQTLNLRSGISQPTSACAQALLAATTWPVF